MKKVLTIVALAACAVSVQAVQINWGSGGNVNVVDGGVSTLYSASGITGGIGLFYLGNTGTGLETAENLTAMDALATSSNVSQKNANLFSEQNYIDSIANISENDVFAVFFVYSSGSVSQFFTDTSLTTAFDSTYTFDGSETDITSGIGAYGDGANAKTAVYVPVPEPATAALAIAGLAMLIRRRK